MDDLWKEKARVWDVGLRNWVVGWGFLCKRIQGWDLLWEIRFGGKLGGKCGKSGKRLGGKGVGDYFCVV